MSKGGNNTGSIRKVEKVKNGKVYSYYEARITTGTDAQGRQKQRSFTGKTQKEVREKMQNALHEINTGSYRDPLKITCGEWLDIWLADYCRSVKPLTLKAYTATTRNHLKPGIGAVRLTDLNAVILQKFFNELSERKASGKQNRSEEKPISAKTVHNSFGVLHKALETAVKVGFIAHNPADAVDLAKVQKRDIAPLSDAELQNFLKAAASDEFADLYTFAVFTGMREGEILGLTWDSIDFAAGTIRIYRQLQRRTGQGYVFSVPKNSRSRIIKPPASIMQLLRNQEKKQIRERFAAGEAWAGFQNEAERKTALVFTKPDGTNLNMTAVFNHYKRIVAEIGIPERRFHDLRHTYATLALQNGIPIKTVSESLGHATTAFTLDVYGHVSETMMDDAAKKMENFIQKIV